MAFCEWKEAWWLERTESQQVLCAFLAEGLRTYAWQQGSIEKECCTIWTAKWALVCERAAALLAQMKSTDREDRETNPLPESCRMKMMRRWWNPLGAWVEPGDVIHNSRRFLVQMYTGTLLVSKCLVRDLCYKKKR